MAVVWLVLAVVFAVLEGITLSLTSIWFAVSAAITCMVSFTGVGLLGQVAIFLTLSILFMLIARPFVKKNFNGRIEKTNTMLGKNGVVLQTEPLRIKIQDLDFAATSDDELAVGDKVMVVSSQGVTLRVRKGN